MLFKISNPLNAIPQKICFYNDSFTALSGAPSKSYSVIFTKRFHQIHSSPSLRSTNPTSCSCCIRLAFKQYPILDTISLPFPFVSLTIPYSRRFCHSTCSPNTRSVVQSLKNYLKYLYPQVLRNLKLQNLLISIHE